MSSKVDIFGTGIQAISDTITAQRRVNIIYDFRGDGEGNPVTVLQTPGLTPYVTLPVRGQRSMWQNGQYAFVVATNDLFLIQNQGFTFLGSFGAQFTPTLFEMKTNLTELVLADGQNFWTFNISNLANLVTEGGQILNGLSRLQTVVNDMWGGS
jgi:hypothetical protein